MAVVKILVVTDGSGGFLSSDFHLGEFLDVLQSTVWEGFTLEVTKAHRENAASAGADIVNFDFAEHDLSQYDEILLFPIRRDNDILNPGAAPRSSNATAAEVAAIARFMDAGGGVFATGDHEDLGAGLCRQLPRIRNMRRWFWDGPGPNGEPVAPRGTPGFPGHPDSELVDRHDTLVAGHDFDTARPNDNYQFDDQSDNVAQRIEARSFEASNSRYFRQTWPHPLLCSADGVVRYLPDHAHEGQCEVPANLALRVAIGGYDEEEYPAASDGVRGAPVVVADARVQGGHSTLNPYKPPVNGKTFGVIGAYDGHRIVRAGKRLGRVVVDATWHHFFNINLTGDASSADAAKRQGFYAPLAVGQPDHYRMIKHYFRNIVYWLLPSGRRRFVFHRALAKLTRTGQFYELNPLTRVRDLQRIEISQLLALGGLADAYFRRAHGACWSLEILPVYLYEFDPFPRIWERFEKEIVPWIDDRRAREREPSGVESRMLTEAWLGSMVLATLRTDAEVGALREGAAEEKQADDHFSRFEKHLPESLTLATQLALKALASERQALDNAINMLRI